MPSPAAPTAPTARGFTLVEILIVVVILGILAAIGSRLISAKVAEAQSVTVEAQLDSLQKALTIYEHSNGRLPETLVELAGPAGAEPEGGAPRSASLISLHELRDPWHHAFVYEREVGNRGYALRSLGADGLPGGSGANADRAR